MNEPTITAEDLSLYALQLLEGDEAARVEVLLRSSSEAREELALIWGDLAIFGLAAEQQAPVPLTRQRLMKQVARERRTVPIPMPVDETARFRAQQAQNAAPPSPIALPRVIGKTEVGAPAERTHDFVTDPLPQPGQNAPLQRHTGEEDADLRDPELRPRQQDTYTPSRDISFGSYSKAGAYSKTDDEPRQSRFGNIFGWMGWAAAATFAVATVTVMRQNYGLQDQIQRQTATLLAANAGAVRAQAVLQTLQSNSAQRFVLARTDTAPVPSGRVTYLPEQGSLVFQGSNLQALPASKTYELWLIPAVKGGQPIAAGTFKPDARGYASVVLPELPKGTIAGNFGITMEDDGGAASPTLPILLVGQQS